jgi:hypothetical protein
MTIKDHEKYYRISLKDAQAAVKRRDWFTASQFYRTAAHHQSVAKAAKSVKTR